MSWDDVIREQERNTPIKEAQQKPGPIRRFLRWLLLGSIEYELDPFWQEIQHLRAELGAARNGRAELSRELQRLGDDLGRVRGKVQQVEQDAWDYCEDLQLALERIGKEQERIAGAALERIDREVDASQLENLFARLHVLESRLGRLFEEGDLGSESEEFRPSLQVTPTPGVEPTNSKLGPQPPGVAGAKKSGDSESVAQIYNELRHLEDRFHDLVDHVETNSKRLDEVEEQRDSEGSDGGGSAEVEREIQRSIYEIRDRLKKVEEITLDQDRRIDAHEREIDGNNRMHEGIDQSTGDFRHRLNNLEDQADAFASEIQDAKQRVHQAETRIQNIDSGLLREHEARVGELEERMYAREMEENRQAAQLASMGGSGVIDELKARVASLAGQMENQTSGPSALDGLLERIRDVEQRMDRGEENNGAFRKEMEETLEKVRYHAEAMDPNAELDDVNTRMQQLEERINQVVSDMEHGSTVSGGSLERAAYEKSQSTEHGIYHLSRKAENVEANVKYHEDRIASIEGALESRSDFRERIEKLENAVHSIRNGFGDRIERLEGVTSGKDESVRQVWTTIIDHASRLEDLERSGRVEADKREKLAIRISKLEAREEDKLVNKARKKED